MASTKRCMKTFSAKKIKTCHYFISFDSIIRGCWEVYRGLLELFRAIECRLPFEISGLCKWISVLYVVFQWLHTIGCYQVDSYNAKWGFYSSIARSFSKHISRDHEAPWQNNLHNVCKHWTSSFLSFLLEICNESASNRESLKPNEFYRLP